MGCFKTIFIENYIQKTQKLFIMKTYVLMISRSFQKSHPKAGQPTFFPQKINALSKLHTIRSNYNLWEKRFEKINKGEACLSLRYWEGLPYKSKQTEFKVLTNTDGIGLQKLNDPDNFVWADVEGKKIDWQIVAENDGLSLEDFCDWFDGVGSEPMAIIHFTHFRY